MLKWVKATLLSIGVSALVGCSTFQETSWVYPPMARPLQAQVEQEIQLVRLSQLLLRDDISDDLRAKIYFERGNNYDILGLSSLARLDFEQSLRFNPAQADVFNMLGVHFTEIGDFDSAYESFGSSLELEPDNAYAKRNQAIALYYGKRPEVALDEIGAFQNQDVDDPFGYIWRYLIESSIDQKKAQSDLKEAYIEYANKKWGWNLVSMMLGDKSDTEIFKFVVHSTSDNTELAQRLTEVYFYLGKRYEMEGRYADAISLFKLAISFNVYEYIEHRYASLELENIYHQLKDGVPSS